MVRLWRLKRWRARIDKAHERKMAALRSKEKLGRYELSEEEYDYYERRKDIDGAIEYALSQILTDKANALDVPKPPYTQKEFWDRDEQDGEVSTWLNVNGRAHVRKLIAEERARRFESRMLWVTKFWLPLLAALVGIIGALTGLFAVLHKPAAPPKENPHVIYEMVVKRSVGEV